MFPKLAARLASFGRWFQGTHWLFEGRPTEYLETPLGERYRNPILVISGSSFTSFFDFQCFFNAIIGLVALQWIDADHGIIFGLIVFGIGLTFDPKPRNPRFFVKPTAYIDKFFWRNRPLLSGLGQTAKGKMTGRKGTRYQVLGKKVDLWRYLPVGSRFFR